MSRPSAHLPCQIFTLCSCLQNTPCTHLLRGWHGNYSRDYTATCKPPNGVKFCLYHLAVKFTLRSTHRPRSLVVKSASSVRIKFCTCERVCKNEDVYAFIKRELRGIVVYTYICKGANTRGHKESVRDFTDFEFDKLDIIISGTSSHCKPCLERRIFTQCDRSFKRYLLPANAHMFPRQVYCCLNLP